MDATQLTENLNPANLTAMGFVCWYAWHTASRVIPKIIEDNRQEMAAARKDFKEELRAEREHCSEELEALRQMKKEA